MRLSKLRTLVVSVALVSSAFALAAGCAAPSEDDTENGSGAMTTGGSIISKLHTGFYGLEDGPSVTITSDNTVLSAVVIWRDGTSDWGPLDIPLTDRSKGTSDETGSYTTDAGATAKRCPFTVEALDTTTVRVTSTCGRGVEKLMGAD